MEAVVYVFVEEASKVPLVIASYQSIVPADAVAARFTVPVPQMEAGVVVVMVGTTSIVALTAVLPALRQVPLFPSA